MVSPSMTRTSSALYVCIVMSSPDVVRKRYGWRFQRFLKCVLSVAPQIGAKEEVFVGDMKDLHDLGRVRDLFDDLVKSAHSARLLRNTMMAAKFATVGAAPAQTTPQSMEAMMPP